MKPARNHKTLMNPPGEVAAGFGVRLIHFSWPESLAGWNVCVFLGLRGLDCVFWVRV